MDAGADLFPHPQMLGGPDIFEAEHAEAIVEQDVGAATAPVVDGAAEADLGDARRIAGADLRKAERRSEADSVAVAVRLGDQAFDIAVEFGGAG